MVWCGARGAARLGGREGWVRMVGLGMRTGRGGKCRGEEEGREEGERARGVDGGGAWLGNGFTPLLL